MSRRRRRNSRGRKSSSGSKQSICPYSVKKHTGSPADDVRMTDEQAEKGEADSLHKENFLCKSDAEDEKDTETTCSEKILRQDSSVGCFNGSAGNQAGSSSHNETSQQEQGVRITTSVTIDNLEQNTSQIVFQRSHGSGSLGSGNSTIAVTTTKLKGIRGNMKIEIREILQVDDSDYDTTFVLQSPKEKNTDGSSDIPNNECFTFSYPWDEKANLNESKTGMPFENMSCQFSVVEMSKEGMDSQGNPVPTTCYNEDTDCYKSCCQERCYGYGHLNHNDTDFTLIDGSTSLSTPSEIWPLQKKLSLANSVSSDTEVDIPPPKEFADREFEDSVNDITDNVALCHISAFDEVNDPGESASVMTSGVSSFKRESTCPTSVDGGRSDDVSASYEHESELDTAELFRWPDTPMSRSSFTKNFIYKHKRKTCMRNNSIAILENSTPPGYMNIPMKRRKTFPAVVNQSSDHQEYVPMCRESFSFGALSPFFMQSLPRERDRAERFYLEDGPFSPHFSESCKSSNSSSNLTSSPVRTHNISSPKHYACSATGHSFFNSDRDAGVCDRGAQELSVVEEDNPESVIVCAPRQSVITESGFDEEIVDMENNAEGNFQTRSVPSKDPFIHITPPSPGSSRESNINSSDNAEQSRGPELDPKPHSRDPESDLQTQRKESIGHILPKSRKSSVTTVMIVGSEQRIIHSHSTDSVMSERNEREAASPAVSEAPRLCPIPDTDQTEAEAAGETAQEAQLTPRRVLVSESSNSIQSLTPFPFEVTDLQSESTHSLQSANNSLEAETKEDAATDKQLKKYNETKSKNRRSLHTPRRPMTQPLDTGRRHSSSRISSDVKQLLKLPADQSHKDPEEASDQWARRRKLFKESKQRSSAGGSSITSNITDESDTMFSEDIQTVDTTIRDIEERGFYTETFHCASWIYRGDDVSPSESPRCLSKRPRPITIRERTIKITKGFGDYPWGFRIQFSKPIVVTEVDTNGAAEEAGLLVGDYVLAVNGTDVTSVPHSEAADLARQGPDLLTLIIGSDISRCPNTPRPACRGYLHKRTQSSLIKGWRKRWFVLRHDCCLYYYKHKKDEGKSQALSRVKLEGAEVEADTSLGKPFVFKCSPASGGRVYYFCATSTQEMKRWLEALSQAAQPVPQNHVWVDVTRHNASLPPLAVKTPECLGLLHQLDRTKDVWLQHYCILKDGCLYFYASIRATNALGGIYLHGYSVREQPLGSKRSTIELRPPSEEFKTFHLCAENPTENKRWLLAIRASISKWMPLHQAIQDYMSKPPEETRM